MHFLNKMERKFGRFAIQGLMKYIILFYVAGYLIEFLAPQAYSFLTLEPYLIFHYGQVWRLVSWVLIPPPTGNFFFAIIMIILYYQLGTALERTWGAFKFNVYIFGGMIFTVLGALLLYVIYGVNTPVSMGGSFSTYYINMTIFLAFAMCYPDMRIMLYFIIPIKMKWMAGIYAALIIYEMIISSWGGRVAIIASVLNFLLYDAQLSQCFTEGNSQEEDLSPSGTAAERCHTPQMCHLWTNRAGRSESGISFLLQMQWKL